MTINATVTETNNAAAVQKDAETAATRGFFAIVALMLVAMVVAFALFGLGGVGGVAIFEAAAMLVVCIVLTRG